MFRDNDRENELAVKRDFRAARISAAIMAAFTVFNLFCAFSRYNIELIAVIISTIYAFVYIKFTVICGELKDLGYKRMWLTLFKTVGLALYLVSLLLCILGIG